MNLEYQTEEEERGTILSGVERFAHVKLKGFKEVLQCACGLLKFMWLKDRFACSTTVVVLIRTYRTWFRRFRLLE